MYRAVESALEIQTEFSEVKLMSDKYKHTPISVAAEFNGSSSPVSRVTLPGRRKLIRLGAAVVPVVATLTSQSALANTCISGSAWGSDQISGSASQAARHQVQKVTVGTGYTITAWNTARSDKEKNSAPWTALQEAYPNNLKNNFNQNEITYGLLAALDSSKFKIPTGFSSGTHGVGSLGDDNKSIFLVAQLNFAANQRPPSECVTSDQWTAILNGKYPSAKPWILSETANYLKANGIVKFS